MEMEELNLPPLHNAARNNDFVTIRKLLDSSDHIHNNKNNKNYIDEHDPEYGSTALMFAVEQSGNLSSPEMVEYLLKNGANPNAKNVKLKNSPPVLEYVGDNSDLKVIKILLDYGADIDYEDGGPLITPSYHNRFEKVKILLEYGAKIDAQNIYGCTALMLAAYQGHLPIVEILLKHEADPNIKKYNGETALMLLATSQNRLPVVEILLKHGADPDIQNNGKTALHIALHYDYYETIKILLEYGANPFILSDNDIIVEYQWKHILKNINTVAKRYSQIKNIKLPKEVWVLILLRERHLRYSQNLDKYKNILKHFAKYLKIPIDDDMDQKCLFKLISNQLAWGGPYSQESVKYFTKQENVEKFYRFAEGLGIDTTQPINAIYSELGNLIGY